MSFVIGPNTKPEDQTYWHITGKDPIANHENRFQPNCMNQIVKWMRDDKVPTAQKVGMLALGILATLAIGWLVGNTFLTFTAITVISTIWAKKEALLINKEEHGKIQELEETAKKLEAQKIAFAKVKRAIVGEQNFDLIPDLDLGDRTGDTGYIDFIQPDEITTIAKGHDKFGRPFVTMTLLKTPEANELRGEPKVLTIFQRYPGRERWTYSFPDNFMNDTLLDEDLEQISQILNGVHPKYQLYIP